MRGGGILDRLEINDMAQGASAETPRFDFDGTGVLMICGFVSGNTP